MRTNPQGGTQPENRPALAPSLWKARFVRLVLGVTVAVALLVALEGGLRLAGYGYPTAFFLSREVNGRSAWVDNGQFGWRFMPRALARSPRPLVMPKQKSPGHDSDFCVG